MSLGPRSRLNFARQNRERARRCETVQTLSY